MKYTGRIAATLFAGALLAMPALTMAQNGYGQPGPGYQQPGYGQPGYNQPGPPPPGQGGWDAPPSDFRQQVQRDGFRDGMYGARKDFENRRRPSVMNRDEYRNYRGPARRAYRSAFERGYNVWWSHQGGPRGY